MVDGARQAEALAELLDTFFGIFARSKEAQRPLLLPALDVLPHHHLAPHPDIMARRAVALHRLATGTAPSPSHPRRGVASYRDSRISPPALDRSPSMKRFRCRISRII